MFAHKFSFKAPPFALVFLIATFNARCFAAFANVSFAFMIAHNSNRSICKMHYVEYARSYVIMFRTMGNTWITDIRHFLDSEGNVIQEPRPARLLAQYFCSIIEAVTGRSVQRQDLSTGEACEGSNKNSH